MAEEFKEEEVEEDEDSGNEEEGNASVNASTNEAKEKRDEAERNGKNDEKTSEPKSAKVKTVSASGFDMVESQTRYFKDTKEPQQASLKEEKIVRNENGGDDSLPESKKAKQEQGTPATKPANEEEKKETSAAEEKNKPFMPKFPEAFPRTQSEFFVLWKSYEPDAEFRTRLLFLLPAEKVPLFFKDSVTPAFLGEVIFALHTCGTKTDAQKTLAWMEVLPNIGRFMMLWFGLTQKDKQSKTNKKRT